jgi:hypothetical protein
MQAQLETRAEDEGQRKKISFTLCLADKILYGAMMPPSCKSMGECVLLGRGEENTKANRDRISKRTVTAHGTPYFHAGQEFVRQQLLVTAMLNPDMKVSFCAKSVAKNFDLRIKDPMTGNLYPDEVQSMALFNQSAALKAWIASPSLRIAN